MVGQAGVEKIITGSTKSNNSTLTSKVNLLKCQRPMLISTFSVRTLNGQARQGEITAMSEKYQIDVTCSHEHRIHHPEETVSHQALGNGWMIITSSVEKAENDATIRGVGMLVSPRAYGCLLNVESVSLRNMVTTFNRNPKTTSLTSCSDETEAVELYSMLQQKYKVPEKDR